MSRSASVWTATLLIAAVPILQPLPPSPGAHSAPGSPALEPSAPSCKPLAPIELQLRASMSGRSDSVQLDYEVTPVIDALALSIELRLPDGGAQRWHDAPDTHALTRGATRSGSARVDLPRGAAGARVQLVARLLMDDPDAPGGRAWVERVETLVRGQRRSHVDEARLIELGGETSLELPAIRRSR